MVWTFALGDCLDAPLCAAMAIAAEQHMGMRRFKPQNLANVAWAIAMASGSHTLPWPLFAALAGAAEQLVGFLNPQGLTNLAWAFAKSGRQDEQLFAILACAVHQRMSEFNM